MGHITVRAESRKCPFVQVPGAYPFHVLLPKDIAFVARILTHRRKANEEEAKGAFLTEERSAGLECCTTTAQL